MDVLLSQRFYPERGGSIEWMYQVYRRWDRPVHVITHSYEGSDSTSEQDSNLTIERSDILLDDWGLETPGKIRKYLRMTVAVLWQLRKRKEIRVHCTHVVPEVVSLIPLRWFYRSRLKIICYAHGEEITSCESSRQLTFLMRRGYRIADHIIANSQHTKELLRPHVALDKVSVIHPGVSVKDYEDLETEGAAWREKLGIAESSVVILTVGRLEVRKNQLAVVAALATLVREDVDVHYVCVGEGPLTPVLEAQAKELGLAERLHLVGGVADEEKRGAYGGCDIFCMPSIRIRNDFEGFGMVFLEAAASGKPTVAGMSGGESEAIEDGKTGFSVDGSDQESLERALGTLCKDPEMRIKFGRAGREHVREFDWDEVVVRILNVVSMES